MPDDHETPRLSPAPKLTPEMASRRAIVLDFVRSYLTRWGQSPSYGEISAGCGVTRESARRSVQRLVRAGQLLKAPGERGLALPGDLLSAMSTLRALGWDVPAEPGAIRPLRPLVRIDYVPDHGPQDEDQG